MVVGGRLDSGEEQCEDVRLYIQHGWREIADFYVQMSGAAADDVPMISIL
ncbi:MAG: hypothetical protein JWL81_2140 [Verrucomicrobiales bacterium]|nr:hypothetical protein [Verrucomicrobiales bacterium]